MTNYAQNVTLGNDARQVAIKECTMKIGSSIGGKLTLLAVLFLVSFLFFGSFSIYIQRESASKLSQLEVNGPLYQRVVQGKDLVADILPPPEYVIETYLVCL